LLRGLSNSRLVCRTHGMNPPSTNSYKHYRFPAEIISHGVWLYFRFCLSYRDVEELLFGSEYEWNRKLGWVLLRIPLVRIAQRTQFTSSHSL
jgi:hypothetical protein